jgi:Zn finger protein HypA/HybF involved in hydrogenase expression
MLQLVTRTPAHATAARSHCPDCNGALSVLRVIPGGAKLEAKSEFRSEYWTMRCTKCGGIHLDILKAKPQPRPLECQAESGADGSPAANG